MSQHTEGVPNPPVTPLTITEVDKLLKVYKEEIAFSAPSTNRNFKKAAEKI